MDIGIFCCFRFMYEHWVRVGFDQLAGIEGRVALSASMSTYYVYKYNTYHTAYISLGMQLLPLYPLTQSCISLPEQVVRSSLAHTAQLPRQRFIGFSIIISCWLYTDIIESSSHSKANICDILF